MGIQMGENTERKGRRRRKTRRREAGKEKGRRIKALVNRERLTVKLELQRELQLKGVQLEDLLSIKLIFGSMRYMIETGILEEERGRGHQLDTMELRIITTTGGEVWREKRERQVDPWMSSKEMNLNEKDS